MKPARPLFEVSIIIAVFAAIWLMGISLTKDLFVATQLDINLHDTYVVLKFSWKADVLLPSLFAIVFIYFVRSAINGFKNRLQNCILLVSTLALNLFMLEYFEHTAKLIASTSYRLVVAFSPKSPQNLQPAFSPFVDMLPVLFIIQIILTLLLVIVAIITGKNWHKAAYETAS